MPWPIRILDEKPAWDDVKVGDAWWLSPHDDNWPTPVGTKHRHLTRVLWVALPYRDGHYPFCVHSPSTREGPEGAGWDVTGEAPNITVNPSINIIGSYHGWIKNGVITDDCEGRKF